MGARQSRVETRPNAASADQKRKDRVSATLQESRAKRLTAVLSGSESSVSSLGFSANSLDPKDVSTAEQGEQTRLIDHAVRPDSTHSDARTRHDSGDSQNETRTRSDIEDSQNEARTRHDSEDSQHKVRTRSDIEDSRVEESTSSDSDSSDSVKEDMTCTENPSLLESACQRENGKPRGEAEIRKGRRSFQPLGRYDRSSSFHDEVDRKARWIRPEDYRFHFENLVFEGGGNKGLAYCGAVRYLEELGVMQNIKRFAGASAGGMVAGLLAVGYTSSEIEEFLADRIDRVFLDASCGYCSLLPNILRSFGWNPGRRIYDWFGEKLREKTGSADVTFHQLYEWHRKMLCIVVTNLSQMTTEYCHPKTTPDMPIRVALRMSMAIPGLFSAMRYNTHGSEDVYVDGGVLCNFPVHCFDGWYLSMLPENSFLKRLQPLQDIPLLMERSNRFGSYNDKTLGMLLYSDAEEDVLRMNLERRVGCLTPAKPTPETKLFLDREKEARQKRRIQREYAQVVQAVDSFLRVLRKCNVDGDDVINRQDLEAAFKDEAEFPRDQAEVLFGKDVTVNEAFDLLDRDNNGQVRYNELVRFIEETGVCLQSRFLGYQRREIKSFVSFLNSLTSTLTFNVQKLYVEERDLERTVGINTGHVQTTDFKLEEPDREFVVERGYNSMKAFLKYHTVRHPDKVTPRASDRAHIPDIPEVPDHPEPPTPDLVLTPSRVHFVFDDGATAAMERQ